MTLVRIAIVGDRDPDNPNHAATEAALQHTAAASSLEVEHRWYATDALADAATVQQLRATHGVFCTTGSPYRSLDGALAAIRAAREQRIPFLGTCGGFQHAVVEYARHVAGLPRAAHGEYGESADAVIAPLSCSLAGQSFDVTIEAGTRASACYGATAAHEHYYCSYGIHQDRLEQLLRAGLPVVGYADDGTPRILELPDHPFFVATLFVPQARSTAGEPHPLITGFLQAARDHLQESVWCAPSVRWRARTRPARRP